MNLRLKRIIGIKKGVKFEDVVQVFLDFRLLLFIYILVLILYIVLFIILKDFTYNIVGKGFGSSFSASFLSDLVFFPLLGFAATIVSVIVSNVPPEKHDFERRAASIANSDYAQKDKNVREFLKSMLQEKHCYCRVNNFTVIIDKYDSEKKAYSVFLQREMYMTNMCQDVDFLLKEYPVSVQPDIDVDGDYGTFNYLNSFIPGKQDVIETVVNEITKSKLKFGIHEDNTKALKNIRIKANSEIGIRFGYNLWSKTGDINKDWAYFQTNRLSSDIQLTITNSFISTKAILFDLRCYKEKEANYYNIEQNKQLFYNSPYILNDSKLRLFPGDRLEFYFHPLT